MFGVSPHVADINIKKEACNEISDDTVDFYSDGFGYMSPRSFITYRRQYVSSLTYDIFIILL